MSGGAFDYVHMKVTDPEYLYGSIKSLEEVEDYLKCVNRKEIADVVRDFREQVSDAIYGAADRGDQLAKLLWEIERAASYDSSVSDIDKAYKTYLQEQTKRRKVLHPIAGSERRIALYLIGKLSAAGHFSELDLHELPALLNALSDGIHEVMGGALIKPDEGDGGAE